MLLHANCISRCRVTENMGYMQELEYRVKGKILPEISGLCSYEASGKLEKDIIRCYARKAKLP